MQPSSQISASMIKELRERTGVGMSKCKEALEQSNGDMEQAIANLRKAGMAFAVKRERRPTNEGVIGSFIGPHSIALVEAAAETDFVVKNERFQNFVAHLATQMTQTNPKSLEEFLSQPYAYGEGENTVEQQRTSLVQALGENIQIKRIEVIPKGDNFSVGLYSHLGGKVVTVVVVEGSNAEERFARDIAMHCAAAEPQFLSKETVPSEIVAKEEDIAAGQAKTKPAEMKQKIVAGKMEAFYDAACLLRQKYIKNDQITIAELLKQHSAEVGHPLQIVNFVRWVAGQEEWGE